MILLLLKYSLNPILNIDFITVIPKNAIANTPNQTAILTVVTILSDTIWSFIIGNSLKYDTLIIPWATAIHNAISQLIIMNQISNGIFNILKSLTFLYGNIKAINSIIAITPALINVP